MIKMLENCKVDTVPNIEKQYHGCKILVTEFYDDCNGTMTGKPYALSTSVDTHPEIQEMCNRLFDDGEDAVVIGFYEEGWSGVQYEHKES